MQVDVVTVRFNNEKLSNDELKRAGPIRGILSIQTESPTRPRDRRVTYATFTNAHGSEPLLTALREAHVSTLKGDDFIVHGLETTVVDADSRMSQRADS